jgi:uncharacterized integral membrane protein
MMVERERLDAPDTDQIPVQTDVPVQEGTRRDGTVPGREGVVEPAGPGNTAGTTAEPHTTPEFTTDPGTSAPVAPTGNDAYKKVRRTKFSGLWVGLTVAALVLLVLLVFIIQNSQSVNISFFGAHGHLSLGVAMLLAAIGGVLLVAIPGYGRILQLRRALRRTGHSKVRAS